MNIEKIAELVAFVLHDNEMLPDVIVAPGSIVSDERGADAIGKVIAESMIAEHRDEWLEALGGEHDAIVSDCVRGKKWAVWLFPAKEEQ